jgi:hypothetical protein
MTVSVNLRVASSVSFRRRRPQIHFGHLHDGELRGLWIVDEVSNPGCGVRPAYAQ